VHRTHYLHGYHGAVPPIALIALFAQMVRSTNRSTHSIVITGYRLQNVTAESARLDARSARAGAPSCRLARPRRGTAAQRGPLAGPGRGSLARNSRFRAALVRGVMITLNWGERDVDAGTAAMLVVAVALRHTDLMTGIGPTEQLTPAGLEFRHA
jgi:hypothetical protein